MNSYIILYLYIGTSNLQELRCSLQQCHYNSAMAFGSVVDYDDNVRVVQGHRRICVLWFGVGCQADSAIIAGPESWAGPEGHLTCSGPQWGGSQSSSVTW